jgi:broad specificity phosphatase PhoE
MPAASGVRTLVLIRHAHRVKLRGGRADNGLSPKGARQAKRVLRQLLREFGRNARPDLVSSPKLRCLETLEPIARKLRIGLEADSLLGEGPRVGPRARRWLAAWKRGRSRLTLACSHGDVLPELLRAAVGAGLDLRKGAWCVLEWDGKQFRLVTLLQEP